MKLCCEIEYIFSRILCLSKDPGCNTRCTPVLSQESTWVCKEVTTCVPRDDEKGHYECDDVTGKKKCLPGWADEINDCIDGMLILENIDTVNEFINCIINFLLMQKLITTKETIIKSIEIYF